MKYSQIQTKFTDNLKLLILLLLLFFSECLFNISLQTPHSSNFSLADIISLVWPSDKATSEKANFEGKFQNCTFQFQHRVTIERTRTKSSSSKSDCEFEYQFFTFDSRSRHKSLKAKNVFICLKDDPRHFSVSPSTNASQWLQSILRLRIKIGDTSNLRNGVAQEKQRRHASELNETICQELLKVVFQDATTSDESVYLERRLEVVNGFEVCSVNIEMPFGYYAILNISIEKKGKIKT